MSEESQKPVEESAPSDLELAKSEAEKFKNEYLYLRADFDNYKKSVIKERSEMMKFGSERIFVEVLEIMDNFDRALSYEVKPENLENFLKGVKMISSEIRGLLSRFNVAEVPALGQKFDPNIHNAIGTEPTDKIPSGHVSQVLKKPYKLYDRVIRPGQVIIADEPKKAEATTPQE